MPCSYTNNLYHNRIIANYKLSSGGLVKHIKALPFILIIILFCSPVQALQNDTLFYAEFTTDDLSEWSIVLGDWEISEGHFCQLACSS